MIASALLLLSQFFFSLRLNSNSFPKPLTAEQEADYLEKAQNGDLAARNLLIEHNLRLVAHIMKKYYAVSADQEDLVSIGTMGLIKAISTYNPEKGIRLATYASRCVENEILMHFRRQKKTASDVSLSDFIESATDGNSLSLLDTLADDTDLFEQICTKEDIILLRKYMEQVLDPRERQVLSLRYGLSGQQPLPQREIAERCGISRSYISRIEKKALGKLRKAFQGQINN